MIAQTPKPPYYAVIFTSIKENDLEGYSEIADKMETLAKQQPGYLGIESASKNISITVSYWESLEAIKQWKQHAEHIIAQQLGKEKWYEKYKIRICLVERDYAFEK
ncbi:MAG: antibiotic biosynthesis monooxygenase [Bacteroidetes bacterium]|nr:antibiotic biosynthesis monooxygenase [Bacteroidota bacterium]MBS1671855.1 antibiotic biosynthesis monooxygenase [Bacteroidota bacterium]